MVELADTQDLGSCVIRCAGSSPVTRTIIKRSVFALLFVFIQTKCGWQDLNRACQDVSDSEHRRQKQSSGLFLARRVDGTFNYVHTATSEAYVLSKTEHMSPAP